MTPLLALLFRSYLASSFVALQACWRLFPACHWPWKSFTVIIRCVYWPLLGFLYRITVFLFMEFLLFHYALLWMLQVEEGFLLWSGVCFVGFLSVHRHWAVPACPQQTAEGLILNQISLFLVFCLISYGEQLSFCLIKITWMISLSAPCLLKSLPELPICADMQHRCLPWLDTSSGDIRWQQSLRDRVMPNSFLTSFSLCFEFNAVLESLQPEWAT